MRILYILICGAIFSCSNGKNDKVEQISDLRVKAKQSMDELDFAAAVSRYDLIINADSSLAEDYFFRAYCNAQLENFDLAAVDYKTSASLDHRKFDCYYSLAAIFILAIRNDSLADHYLAAAYDIS